MTNQDWDCDDINSNTAIDYKFNSGFLFRCHRNHEAADNEKYDDVAVAAAWEKASDRVRSEVFFLKVVEYNGGSCEPAY